ncbi:MULTISPECIES: response regulator transcription factor [unclassified Tolypothrix]|uniref:response regulator transcription factor n=1 Tax=unclassified Tolypothrix TaxID=2649714 RepID=UPI0005EAAE5C|nr:MULTISPECIES: response regulator transcription factor [unclassified Tolypothrix]BAY93824.1 LuxR family two component transcriptional regulator [Microchaete diplosiphon NIES-3275]EKF03330.1 response regulator [Tolypothrix sp. PCC 7601]MBE9081944.1 response regulator transcription factor [Tolypothrix sp. LEGE 11397]UYD27610.1 response regulator transcription factor [Tolypothrix sp. PCC 7712]UYD36527.1 response regulator transcription factor [Tolypothrix sp. PCC 7601]
MAVVSLEKHQLYGHLPVEKKLNILVVDDHQLILTGTFDVLSRQYPEANILKAQTAKETLTLLQSQHFDIIMMDLSIPNQQGETAEIDTGIKLLQTLLKEHPDRNFMVQTSYVKALIRIKHEIDNHQAGFAIADKGLPEAQMLMRVNLALQGGTHTKDIKTGIELKPEWLEVLRLAFEESLTDKAIAERMYKSERAVRTYWTKIQDVLGVYPEDCKQSGKNMRIQTEVRAREEGLID